MTITRDPITSSNSSRCRLFGEAPKVCDMHTMIQHLLKHVSHVSVLALQQEEDNFVVLDAVLNFFEEVHDALIISF